MRAFLAALMTLAVVGQGMTASADPGDVDSAPSSTCTTSWTKVGSDTFRLPSGLLRSQGVTSDGSGWIFSWQGGLERTDDRFLTMAVGTLPPDIAVQPQASPDGSKRLGGNHIGDIDVLDGKVYAPVEDGRINAQVVALNDPAYQTPYIALYDARTLAYTGVRYALEKNIHEAGVPWVAVNRRRQEVYTAEWDMRHDRINVFDTTMNFQRFLPLIYPAELGPGFHLSRIQGAKVLGRTLYATRDDADKTVFAIDLKTGDVTPLFALRPGVPAELEGLSVRLTPDGALLHVLIILHNKADASGDAANIQVALEHFAPVPARGCAAGSEADPSQS